MRWTNILSYIVLPSVTTTKKFYQKDANHRRVLQSFYDRYYFHIIITLGVGHCQSLLSPIFMVRLRG
jgi:hypothetical protein